MSDVIIPSNDMVYKSIYNDSCLSSNGMRGSGFLLTRSHPETNPHREEPVYVEKVKPHKKQFKEKLIGFRF